MKIPDESDLLRAAAQAADGESPGWPAGALPSAIASRLRRLSQIARLAATYRTLGEGGAPLQAAAAAAREPLFRWGPLEVLEKLGEGSFGDVFRAWDPSLRREVALKLRRPSLDGGDGAGVALEEARRLARVRHPNVLTVHGAAAHDGRVGLWTDLLAGCTLEEWLRTHGPMSAREAALIGLDLLRALAAVHAAGLVHGDLKAANVMREGAGVGDAAGAGRIVLMDFGSGSESGRPPALGPAGTPAVMAPEVLEGGAPIQASDLYSLGVLLYRLVSGRYPVEADTVDGILAMHRRSERVPLRDRRADLPAPFVQVVERALSRQPARRYASTGAMEAALAAALEVPAAGTAAAPVASTPRPARAWAWATAVVLLGAALWLGLSQRRGRDGATATREAADGIPAAPRRGASDETGRSPEAGAPPSATSAGGPADASPGPGASAGVHVEATLYRARGGVREALSLGSRVQPRDHLFLELECTEPMHVYVLNEDQAGGVFVLFPIPGVDLTNPLPPGAVHRLPGRLAGRPFDWVVTSAGGRESFLIVASRRPLPGLEQALALIEPARPGRPVSYAELDDGTLGALRGVGGMSEAEPSTVATAQGKLARLARDLERQARAAGGLWVRWLDVENPAP